VKSSQLFNVPATEEGNEFIRLARKFLNPNLDVTLWARARGCRHGNSRYHYSMPLSKASWIAIYARQRDGRTVTLGKKLYEEKDDGHR